MFMKKLASLVLALTLCAGLAVPALAAEGETIGADIGAINEPTSETVNEAETAPESAPEAAPEIGQLGVSFLDVPENHTFYAAVMDCAAKGITSGYADGTFKPTASVTKAQFSVMLSRAFYSSEVEKYNTKVYTDQGWFVPNTRALYMAGVLTDTSFVNYFATADVMGQTINRYDMAQLITNIMTAKGFSATSDQKSATQAKISDYKSIPAQYQDAVKNVFALGIITGYSDGTFGGNNVMNRGQGCVVIYRMAQYTPAASNPVTPEADVLPVTKPETPAQPAQPEQPETPAVKTLRNGKPVTEENVLELLDELQAKYPTGTSFANGYSQGNSSTDVRRATNTYTIPEGGGVSTRFGCGAWAALASDYIFGQTGFPARKVSFFDTRPGDLVIAVNDEGKLTHVMLAISKPQHDDECAFTELKVTDAATSYGVYQIAWDGMTAVYDDGFLAENTRVWTRYPN